MEFHEKLQQLRKQKGLTQEELASALFVSRTAVSKWESGRGYPEIDSLKAISKFFSVSLDELLSTDELLTVAEQERDGRAERLRDRVFGLLDVGASLLLFLPLFAVRGEGSVAVVSLLTVGGLRVYLKVLCCVLLGATVLMGGLTLALQAFQATKPFKAKTKISLAISALTLLLFVLSLQPYAAVFVFLLLAMKVILLLRRK